MSNHEIPRPVAIPDNPPVVHRSPVIGLESLTPLDSVPVTRPFLEGHLNVAGVPALVEEAVHVAEAFVRTTGSAGEGDAEAYLARVRQSGATSVARVVTAVERAKVRGPQADTVFVPIEALKAPTTFLNPNPEGTGMPHPANADQPTRKFPPVSEKTDGKRPDQATGLFPLRGVLGVIAPEGNGNKDTSAEAATVIVPKPGLSADAAKSVTPEPSPTGTISGSVETFAPTVKVVKPEEPKPAIIPDFSNVRLPKVEGAYQPEQVLSGSGSLPTRNPNASGHGRKNTKTTFGSVVGPDETVVPLSAQAPISVTEAGTFGSVVTGSPAAESVTPLATDEARSTESYTLSKGVLDAFGGGRKMKAQRIAGIMGSIGAVELGSAGLE